MRILIAGGCKNGKSYYAQQLAKLQQKEELYYVATMSPCDQEDEERILRHQLERKGWGFTTIECHKNIAKSIAGAHREGSFLLDSTTALLSNEMFDASGNIHIGIEKKIGEELVSVLSYIADIVIVSDYIYSDAMQYDEGTQKYIENLAYLDKLLAKHCEVVLEVAYGNIIIHKGKEVFLPYYEKISQGILDGI